MKKTAALILAVLISALSILTNNCNAVDAKPSDSAAASVLYCADSKQVLCGHDENTRLPIACITKIMTCLLALETAEKNNAEVRITSQMYAEGSSMYLKEGEVLTLSSLATGMMACSGNDAANAISYAVGGSTERFVGLMNKRAQSLGMRNTHFVTPSGLDDSEHFSTAYDMALLGAAAMENEDFRSIVSSESVRVNYVSPAGKSVVFTNHNRLLRRLDGCIGIKTGYTKTAGRTLVSCTEREGVRLIAVTLNDPDDWDDHETLIEYGFSVVSRVRLDDGLPRILIPVAGTGKNAELTSDVEPYAVVRNDDRKKIQRIVYAPHFLYPGEVECALCRIEYRVGERVLFSGAMKIKTN